MLNFINRLNAWIGKSVSWLTAVLVVLVVSEVLLRAFLNYGQAWMRELQWQLFALVFLLGAPYALQQNRHVRVDLFYERFSARQRAQVNLVGSLVFLIPWCLVLIWFGSQFAYEAYLLGEASADVGGLPTMVPIKVALPLAALLLFLQAVAQVILAWRALKQAEL